MKRKLLVVDDDPAVRKLLRRMLGDIGHDVIEAEDGGDAVRIVETERPALVLLDIHMPKVDGIAALDAIREMDSQIGVIMITGDGNPGRASLAMERGACDFVSKPFDPGYLKTTVEANLLARG